MVTVGPKLTRTSLKLPIEDAKWALQAQNYNHRVVIAYVAVIVCTYTVFVDLFNDNIFFINLPYQTHKHV